MTPNEELNKSESDWTQIVWTERDISKVLGLAGRCLKWEQEKFSCFFANGRFCEEDLTQFWKLLAITPRTHKDVNWLITSW